MINQEYIESLVRLHDAVDEGIVTSKAWLDNLLLSREALGARIQEARAEFHGVKLNSEYPVPNDIASYISGHYSVLIHEAMIPMRLIAITETAFTLDRLGFKFEIPIGMINQLR